MTGSGKMQRNDVSCVLAFFDYGLQHAIYFYFSSIIIQP